MAKFDNILGTVGNTPVVRINRLAPQGVNLFVKIEAFNPLGSVKDRLALGVIEAAEQSGELKPAQTVIEATSGNTGIGLAMVCASKGYPLVVTMAEQFSVERRKLMRFLGAKVVLTPAAGRALAMVIKAVELDKTHGWFLTRQFENEANADIHSRTTAREIVADFRGEKLDYWVTGYGTGGTLKGVSRVLAKEMPDTRIIVCEPEDAQLLGSGAEQVRNPDGSAASPHPAFKPHPKQGWTPDFIPAVLQEAIARIPKLREEFWNNVNVPGLGETFNQSLERAGRVADFLEFGELMCRDALARDESCGGHFREEHQTADGEALRDDENFADVFAWEYEGDVATEPKLHTEPLVFESVHLATRSYK